MTTPSRRRSPKATVPKIAVERATLALQQLPTKPGFIPPALKATTRRGPRTSVNSPKVSSAKTSIAAALSRTAIAEKKAFLNRKINDVISVLLDDSPPKPKKKERKLEKGNEQDSKKKRAKK